MEQVWNKKKLIRLMQADPETVEDFFNSHVDVIYTWIYYQVGADPEIALDLTGHALCQGLMNISQFDPNQESLLQWIKQQASQARDEGLLRCQKKSHRPWAWSQLTDPILCGLSKLRSEPLTDEVAYNPYIQEIAQAALVELEQSGRELMMHRYNHLDIPEHIAEEMHTGVEEINDKLYRCRHSFRRVFFHLIASSNQGFSESNAPGSLEILDSNLEKLLSSTTLFQSLTDKQRNEMLEKVSRAACDLANSQSLQTDKSPKMVILASSVIAVVLTVVIGIVIMTRSGTKSQTSDVPQKPTAIQDNDGKTQKPTVPNTEDEKIDEEEIKRIILLGQTGDLNALLQILKSGQFTSQLAAAHFIGRLGDESAIGLLEEAEEKWYPNGPDDNPFAEAIIAIEDRLFPESDLVLADPNIEPAVIKPAPAEDKQPDEPKPVTKEVSALAGTVIDFSGQPIAGAKIELYRNGLRENKSGESLVDIAQTDDKGQYQITDSIEGPFWAHCDIQSDESMKIKRSLWCSNNKPTINNFGGQPALTGSISIQGTLLANEPIYLSDTLKPTNASFSIRTGTDNEGHFAFLGVDSGTYYLLADRDVPTRLSEVVIPANDTTGINLDLDLHGVEVVLDIISAPDDLEIVRSVLMYTPDMTPDAFRISAIREVTGTYVFDDVLPGNYYLFTMLENDVWMQQEVVILPSPDRQAIALNEIPDGDVTFSGRFVSPSPIDLFLTDANQQVRIPLVAQAGGAYQVEFIRPDMYTLSAIINDFTVEFTDIDLQTQTDVAVDLDPTELINSVSPLYVMVVDSKGKMVSNAEVWLTGGNETITTQSTGRGAFLAVPAGEYTLYAVLPGQRAAEQPVTIEESSLLTSPNPDHIVLIQLSN